MPIDSLNQTAKRIPRIQIQRNMLVALHGDFDRLSVDQSRSGSWVGSTSSLMLRGVLGCLRMKPARSSVSTI
jgi:hypothetical protein